MKRETEAADDDVLAATDHHDQVAAERRVRGAERPRNEFGPDCERFGGDGEGLQRGGGCRDRRIAVTATGRCERGNE